MTSALNEVPPKIFSHAIGRPGRFLRTSTILMALVAILALLVVTYVEWAYVRQQGDFANNRNLRIISISHKSSSSGPFGNLEFKDSDRIAALLDPTRTVGSGRSPASGTVVSNRYELGAAIATSNGGTLFVYGFDPDFAPALGLPEMRDGVGYGLESESGEVDLRIPAVTAGENGYSSGSVSPQHLTCRGLLRRYQLDYLLGGAPGNAIIVNTATFAKIASAMYSMDWTRVRRSWERGELSMTPLIGGIAVYLSSIDGVRPAARLLQRAGYSVDYGLRAFDDLARSLRQSTALAAGLILLLSLGAGAYVVVSWRAYLRLSRRDIGILKHWGVPHGWIRAGYGRRLLLSCLQAMCGCFAASLVAGVIAFGPSRGIGVGLLNGAVVSGVLLAVWRVACRRIVGRQVEVDTLTLLTREREFQ